VVDFLSAGRDHLTFRLGLQWREPLASAPPPDSLLAARYIRIQAASPPPQRIDGTRWDDGLVVTGGGRFDREKPPADWRVDPLDGVAPLRQPDPATIVLDRWLAVPAVPPRQALTRAFAIGPADPSLSPLSFPSAPYPAASIGGKRLAVVGVAYAFEGTIRFDREAEDEWIAVSLERFFPPERPSPELIVRVQPGLGPGPVVERGVAGTASTEPDTAARTFPITAAWRADPLATSATRSSPASP